jgi:hypothetical protein
MGLLDKLLKVTKSDQPTTTELTLDTAIKIIQDYGAFVESATHAPGCVVDARNLPHPKQRIKQALILALRSTTDPQKRDWCRTGLLYLADWQEGVGNEPVGLDLRKIDRNATPTEQAKQAGPMLDGWKKWSEIVEAERKAVWQELTELGLR